MKNRVFAAPPPTLQQHPDYSPDAWGGYDGPFIDSVRLENTPLSNPEAVILG